MVRFRRRKLPDGVVDIIRDRSGRDVTLTEERWRHILKGHPEMEGLEHAVKRVLENADVTRTGNTPGTRVIYGRNLGPARWLAVVVAYDDGHGEVLTAYPKNRDPGGDE